MVNESRGEISLELGGRSWKIRPTFQVIREIESALSCSIFELGLRLIKGGVSVTDLAMVLWIALSKEDKDLTINHVGEWLLDYGAAEMFKVLDRFLENAMSPGREAKSKSSVGEGRPA